MLDKLLSLVPYNPGMAHQLAFYGRRMHEETSVRRLGMVFIVLAFVVQSFAVLSPPQSAVASSDNDLLNGGFSTKAEARKACENNTQNYMGILHAYGISCSAFDAADADVVYLHSNDNNDYYSAGHNAYGVTNEHGPISIDGGRDIYWRPLSTWGNPAGGWKALRLRDQNNNVFYILYACGNLVHVGFPHKNPLTVATETGGYGNVPTTPAPTPTPTPAPTPAPTPTPQAPSPTPTTPTPTPTPCQYNPSIPADSSLCYQPCQYNGSIPATDSACKPCDKSSNQQDTISCVSVRKAATNVTQNIADANNTTAKPGDVITYTLYATNQGKAVVKDFTFQENLSDVLDYADVTDPHGGLLSNVDHVIAWPTRDIQPSETASVQVTVKVKNPIPSTPASSSDPAHFDLIMTNVYGNAINIKVPSPPTKTIETAATKLPNTGPGTTIAIAVTVIFVAGYFYSRASLLARESDIALKENA